MSCDFVRAILVKVLFTVRAGRPLAARCWLTNVTTCCSAACMPDTLAAEDADADKTELAALEEALDVLEVLLEEDALAGDEVLDDDVLCEEAALEDADETVPEDVTVTVEGIEDEKFEDLEDVGQDTELLEEAVI